MNSELIAARWQNDVDVAGNICVLSLDVSNESLSGWAQRARNEWEMKGDITEKDREGRTMDCNS